MNQLLVLEMHSTSKVQRQPGMGLTRVRRLNCNRRQSRRETLKLAMPNFGRKFVVP